MARTKEKITVKKHNIDVLENFRSKLQSSDLNKDEKAFIIKELEASGAASMAISEIDRRLKVIRVKIHKSKEYQLEKELKAKRKQVVEMQRQKTQKVLGVLEMKYAEMRGKGLGDVVGLLERGK